MIELPTPETDSLFCRNGYPVEVDSSKAMQLCEKLEQERDWITEKFKLLEGCFKRAERERDEALEKIKQQKLEIVRLNGATNHAGGTPLKIALRERDEVQEAFKIVYNERVQMELERNEWKNKAYSHATDYTLMEAKCFRLEQQLKEYDKLKS